MQPNHEDDTWQKPSEQPSQAPYAADSDTPKPAPVVSLSPEQATPEDPQPGDSANKDLTEPVHWEATEYIHREKDVLWFIIFGVVVAGLVAAALFLMDSLSFAIL